MHWQIYLELMMNNQQSGFQLIKSNLALTYRFYRNTMTREEIQWYDAIVRGVIDYEKSIRIRGADLSKINRIFEFIKLDNPLLFFVESLNINYESLSKTALVFPIYRFEKGKTDNTIIALLSKVKSILIPTIQMDEFNREKAIHDFFCINNHYDNDFAESSYECVGPLLFRKGVCEGISKAVKLLCDFSKIKCIILHGNAVRTDNANKMESHAWNKISINNCFYNLDVTFDLTISMNKTIRYDYFNLSDSDILMDHDSKQINLIPCRISNCFYDVVHLAFKEPKEIENFFIFSIKNKQKKLVLKISNEAKQEVSEKDIIKYFNNALVKTRQFNKRYEYTFNKYQKVIQIDFI